MVGQKFQEWNVERCIGEGSYGKVYKIVRKEFGHTYEAALKVIDVPQHQSDVQAFKSDGMTDENVTVYFQQMVERIVDEFALMAKLKGNSNIVSYEDHIVEEKENEFGWRIYIRMELLTPLFEHIKAHGLSEKDIVKLGMDICRGLELCKKNNIIHRDIKPENIFISKNGDYKLGDFGIARELEKTSAMFTKVGTKNYMAPEVFKGEEYNSSVDIYSLGIVMYRYLNENRHPFIPLPPKNIQFTDQENATIKRMRGEVFPVPVNACRELSDIVLKACSFCSEDRYPDPSDMRMALEAVYKDANDDIILRIETQKKVDAGDVEKSNDKRYITLNNSNIDVKKDIVDDIYVASSASNSNKMTVDEDDKSKGIGKLILLCLLIGISLGMGIFYFTKNNSGNIGTMVASNTTESVVTTETSTTEATTELPSVIVPDLVGMTDEQCDEILIEVNLASGDVEKKYSDSVKKGQIISQDPVSGTVVREGATVNVVISKGVEKVAVPDLYNLALDDAKSSLKKVGLKSDVKYDYNSSVSAGYVFKQSVASGKKLAKGKSVVIYISNGSKPTPVVTTPNKSNTANKSNKSKKKKYDWVLD